MLQFKYLSDSLQGVGIEPTSDIFDELAQAYAEPSRHYHNQQHIAECLEQLETFQHLATRQAEVAIAIWFHDAIYDSQRKDNEEASAQWAKEYLETQNVDAAIITRITDMILATKTHHATSGDSALIVDIDLSILGASPARFAEYDQAIRREYQWVPEDEYEKARAQVLQSFLEREQIYQHDEIREQLEAQARANLQNRLIP